jgi:hypothetical protein
MTGNQDPSASFGRGNASVGFCELRHFLFQIWFDGDSGNGGDFERFLILYTWGRVEHPPIGHFERLIKCLK